MGTPQANRFLLFDLSTLRGAYYITDFLDLFFYSIPLILRKLAVIQIRVETILCQQAFMSSLLDDIAVVHH